MYRFIIMLLLYYIRLMMNNLQSIKLIICKMYLCVFPPMIILSYMSIDYSY